MLLKLIPILEDTLPKLGVAIWVMENYEADDALAPAVRVACEDHTVHKVFVLTPKKDLGQVVQGKRVVQRDQRNNVVINEDTVKEKFGIGPSSIADYLGLVGDSAEKCMGWPRYKLKVPDQRGQVIG